MSTNPNGYIIGSNGLPLELTDAEARRQLAGKLNKPDGLAVGDFLKVRSIGADGSVELEGARCNAVHIATEHGISTDAEDNTPALQALVDQLSAAGGGIIFFPVGVYNFAYNPNKQGGYAVHERAIHMRSNVSIVGENLETTVLKQTTQGPYSLFYFIGTPDAPITGCHFSNFTVDAYGTGDKNAVFGKVFFFQYVRDCVFRDLRLMGTVATAMGIDFLDRVVIDNVSCIDCGRTFTGSEAGTSGIGIGTAGWENENFIVTNCVCEGCGQYGIFIENQGLFGDGNVDYAKGCIISNCIVRNGLNKGIGVRGGQNVTVIGCEAYENTSHGIYVDNNCRDVKIVSCSSNGNGAAGIHMEPNAQSVRIAVRGCHCADNERQGIAVSASSMSLGLIGNYTAGNSVGLEIADVLLIDCAIKGNILFDGDNVRAVFRGDNKFNDFADIIADTQTTSITADLFTAGYKLEPDGSLSAAASAHTTLQYIDVSRLSDSFKFVYDNPRGNSVRIAQYDSNRVSLGDDFEMNWQTSNPASITVDKLDGCKYIRISTSNGIAVGELEGDADPDADVIKSSTITGSMFTEGFKIDADGSVAEQANATAVLAYIDVGDFGDVFTFTFSNPSGNSIRIAQYSASKVSLSDNFGMEWHSDNPSTITIKKLAGCRYIRISSLYGVAAGELKSTGPDIIFDTTITEAMYTDDTKILPDGSTVSESGTYSIVSYIDVSALSATFAFEIGDPQGTGLRIAQYDADKNSLSTTFPLLGMPAQGDSLLIEKMDGCRYIRIFSSTARTVGRLIDAPTA